ncbi:hypothetical protein HRM2_p00140 (plasmid) [Desulforapulum autotrophicum HRM2]|uniref:Uncharacterized protein n=1 Tax=Desulforapulum autotrophicum (strain ATCC 43914 / DSM 3382 / VKM B-1955 / HRM2) TaxID=177437 RepID=C0QML4_DESAH|nr:hypothetical protein [Desulforapulum autotrophicum]ACN18008.1 hypothetical protein HRM2_p00140 [Desulforapulum autotrophicum HRM2]
MIIYHDFKAPVQPPKKNIQKEIEIVLKKETDNIAQIDQIMGGIPFEDAVAMGLIEE